MRVRQLMVLGLTGLLVAAGSPQAIEDGACGDGRHSGHAVADAPTNRDHYLHHLGLRWTSDFGGWSTDPPVPGTRPGDQGTIMRASPHIPAHFEGVLEGPVDDVRLDLYSMIPAATADGRPLQLELLIDRTTIFARDVPTVATRLAPGDLCHRASFTLVTAHVTGIGDALEDAGFDRFARHEYWLRVAPALGADTAADVYGVSTRDTPSRLTVHPTWTHPRTPVTDVSRP